MQVPFELNETDGEATVVLMTDIPVVDIAVVTPAGAGNYPGDCGKHECDVRPYIFREILPIHAASGNGRRRADGQVGGAAYARRAAI